ncbi:hypothetical protein [Helicobacter suis]|uniref:hypothetical protein n=1 Tax=Helicobacter suis TaxID=104628 RepID=UPI0002DCD50A|nr:hypothetical protein [Helicobacter suis]BDR27906.1 hypothetical protein HSHS1_06670 [Helicobacter suis HS1]
MGFSKALQKLNDRISGLNVMRGRLIKFVNPTQADTQTTQVGNISAPTQVGTQTAPKVELSDQQKQERLDLINRLIRTNKITNEDLAPLGLHFENTAPFNGKVWNQENLMLTSAFKDYLKGLDSISALAICYEAMKSAQFRKMDCSLILGDSEGSGLTSFYYRYVLGLGQVYCQQIKASENINKILYALVSGATQYMLVAANAPTDNTEAQNELRARMQSLQEAFNDFYRDFSDDTYTLAYSLVFASRSLELKLPEPLTMEHALRLRRNMRPDCYSVVPRIVGGFSPRVLMALYVAYAVGCFTLEQLRRELPPRDQIDNMPSQVQMYNGQIVNTQNQDELNGLYQLLGTDSPVIETIEITPEIKNALSGFYNFIQKPAISIDFSNIDMR